MKKQMQQQNEEDLEQELQSRKVVEKRVSGAELFAASACGRFFLHLVCVVLLFHISRWLTGD